MPPGESRRRAHRSNEQLPKSWISRFSSKDPYQWFLIWFKIVTFLGDEQKSTDSKNNHADNLILTEQKNKAYSVKYVMCCSPTGARPLDPSGPRWGPGPLDPSWGLCHWTQLGALPLDPAGGSASGPSWGLCPWTSLGLHSPITHQEVDA